MKVNDYVWHRHSLRYGRIVAVDGIYIQIRYAYFNYEWGSEQWVTDDMTEWRILKVPGPS